MSPSIPAGPLSYLPDDVVFRGAIVALQKLREEAPGRDNAEEYRLSALSWVRLAVQRLERTT